LFSSPVEKEKVLLRIEMSGEEIKKRRQKLFRVSEVKEKLFGVW